MSYFIDSSDSVMLDNHKLYRVIYNKDIYYKPEKLDIICDGGPIKLASRGDKGGYIESQANLKEGGYISPGSQVFGNACVKNSGVLLIRSIVTDDVIVENGAMLVNCLATGKGTLTNLFYSEREHIELENGEERDGIQEERASSAIQTAIAYKEQGCTT